METVFLIIGFVLLLTGLLGCVLPIVPGPPIAFVALLLNKFVMNGSISNQLLVVYAVLNIILLIIDYLLPIWAVQTSGGTKSGVRGSTIGMIAGLFVFPPFGILLGPFLGAVIGELLAGNNANALKSGLFSFVGFLGGVLMKVALCISMTYHFIVHSF
jgi:hypothetical protein